MVCRLFSDGDFDDGEVRESPKAEMTTLRIGVEIALIDILESWRGQRARIT